MVMSSIWGWLFPTVTPIIFDKSLSYGQNPEGYIGDAGLDLRSSHSHNLISGNYTTFETGIGFSIPRGYHGRVTGRSSFNVKGIICLEGTVDSGYGGMVRVALFNASKFDVLIEKDERIAQIVFMPFLRPPVRRRGFRNANGFGSTGKK